jgi:hypothetical protein
MLCVACENVAIAATIERLRLEAGRLCQAEDSLRDFHNLSLTTKSVKKALLARMQHSEQMPLNGM